MGLKEIYLSAEDRWYNALDKIDAHIPVYRVVDRIDAVAPSFAVFIAIVACIAVALVVAPVVSGQQANVVITVEDAEGNLLQGVEADYTIAGIVNSAVTNENGEISILVPFNSTVGVKVPETAVGGEEFEQAEKSFFVGEEATFFGKIILREKSPAFVERTVLFQDSAGERIEGKAIRVRLSCQNPLVTPSPLEVTDLDMDGSITVREPRDCGVFQITVMEPAEFRHLSYILDRLTQTIRLEANQVAKGSLRVRIKDESGNVLVSTNFDVTLLDATGMRVGEKYSQSYGEALFSGLTAGTYAVSVEDPAGNYAIASQSGISVRADETTAVDIGVSKTVKATLNVSVVDKGSGGGIPNAVVRLINEEMETIAEKSTGGKAEALVFRLTEQGNYTLFAMHPDYLYEIVELQNVASADIEIEMRRMTEDNSGRVKVRVVDEDGSPVKNARVKLRFLLTGMLVPIEPEKTDRNGVARFVGVKEGAYYAYVEKFPAFGDNKGEGKEINIREVTVFSVRLVIGNSIAKVRAVDEDLVLVPEAEAEFFSQQGESLGKIPLTDGTGQFALKADKKAYVVVSQYGYMSVQTMPKQLWPDKAIEFEALMEPRLILGNPLIEFAGIFDMAGNQVQQLDSGNRYVARFKLSVPEEGNFEKGGFHFRVGDEKLLVNDPMVIKEAVAGNIIAPLKGSSYTPPLGYAEDSENLTEGDAKWVNIMWNELEPMNYYFGFEIRVKSQITPYTRLPMHYRAWAIDEAGDYARVPVDSEIGIAESVASKQALYAKTLELAFLEGQAAECMMDFCYSGESFLDEDKGLYIYEPYEMRSGSPHLFTFSVLNNSERQYDNSELYITCDGLTIDSYKIQDASASEISASGVDVKKVEAIGLGPFTKGKSISAELHLTPSEIGNASIGVKVIADGRVVFLKTISGQVVSERSMAISAKPEKLPTYVQNNLQVGVKTTIQEQEFDLDDVLVKVKVLNPDKTEMFFGKKTNAFGIAEFNLLPAMPGTTVKIEAEKPGYYAEPLILTVASDVLHFLPEELQAGLNTRDRREHSFISAVENTTGLDLVISEVKLTGNFKGMLDEQTMLNFSRQHIGSEIAGLNSETMQFFMAKLSENAGEILVGKEELSGEFVVTATSPETLASWDIVVSMSINIAVGGLPDNSPCLIVTKSRWDGVTLQNKATVEFEVKNHCISGSNFVELENLQAKVVWESDEIGTVELSLTEAESGASNSAVLRTQLWTRLFKSIKPEATYYGMLTFTPKSGHIGEEASFSLNIDAEILTDSGPEFVGSSPNSLKSTVKIINLASCVTFPEDVVWIRPSTKETVVTIDSSLCGSTEVDFALCWQDPGCRGGTSEGYIQLSTDRFTLRPNATQKEVLVSRGDLPGAYGITVYAKIPGTSYRKIGEIVVNINAETGTYWDLDKYTFSIIGIGASDAATLSNIMLEEEVQVTASVCDWGEAQEDKEFSPIGAAAGAGIGSYIGTQLAVGMVARDIARGITSSIASSLNLKVTELGSHVYSSAYSNAQGALWSEGLSETGVQAASESAASATASNMTGITADATTKAGEAGTKAGATAGKMPGYIGPVIGGIVTYAVTGDPVAAVASTIGGIIGNAVCGPACGIAGSMLGSMVAGLFGDDPCEEDLTQPLPDFVINLAGSLREFHGKETKTDAEEIRVVGYESGIEALWNTIDRQVVEEKEKVGVVFTNVSGIEEVEPIYALAEFRATEHIHGDSTHQRANVHMSSSNFAPYAIPDSYTDEHVQRFHLRFKTKNIPRVIPPISYDSYECTQGTMIGRTGPGALPSIRLDWGWDDATGIAYNSCDYENEDYVYCDATQFAIELSKRIQMVEEFMKANEYRFSCPNNGSIADSTARSAAYNQEHGSQEVDADMLGFKSMSLDYANETLSVNVVVENGTGSGQDATVVVVVKGSSGNDFEESCTKSVSNILEGKTSNVQCVFTGVVQHNSQYAVAASLSSNTTAEIDDTILLSSLIAAEETGLGSCWLPPSTDYYKGIPGVSYYVDALHPRVGQHVTEQSIAWTGDVQSVGDLVELTHFKAYLIQDGYGSDFRQDFAEFYTATSFFDAPFWFADDETGKLATYFADDEAMVIGAKYTLSDQLPGPGLYKVDIGITYENQTWALYDAYGQPNARIFVQLHRIKEPSPDSVFYYMPFDGYVGRHSEDGRQFYGMNYINIDKPIAVVATPELLTTEEVIGSNSFSLLTTEVEQDFKRINSVAADRGFIMDVVETSPNSLELVFSPNYATPVAMKISRGKSDEPFSAFYELRESGTPVETGSNLTFWDGMGQCLDYSGVPVVEAFDFKPDREANETDPMTSWQFAYAVDWLKADYGGEVYLKSVFYTPENKALTLGAVQPETLRFITPDSVQNRSVELSGISEMPHNSMSSRTSVGKLEDVFDLVSSKHVCITNSGTRTAFWWNPKILHETAGSNTSIKAIEQGLVEGQNCIGYGS